MLQLLKEDEELAAMTSDDPEIQFLRSLNPEQRKKLLKCVIFHVLLVQNEIM